MVWYHVAEPSAYLAITGAGVDGVQVKKKALVLPFQRVCKVCRSFLKFRGANSNLIKFSITPFDFSLSLQAMTIEKLNFSLPCVMTIGPDDNEVALVKYAILLTGNTDGGQPRTSKTGTIGVAEGRNHVQTIVKGVIEGETRSIVSTMTMEELFKERKIFRDKVIKNVQSELDQFGLKIYNANVKELMDTPGSEYFAYLSRKAHEGASNQAKVDVAEARMKGEIGEADRQGQAKQAIAKIHADTAVQETLRKKEKAKADAELTQTEIEIEKKLKLDRIEATRAAEQRDAELQKGVEEKRAHMELERQRATTVTKAVIARESDQQKADALLYTQRKNAEAHQTQKQAETDALFYRQTRDADAKLFTIQQDAAGYFEKKTKEAEAVKITTQFTADADLYRAQQEAQASYERTKLAAEAKVLESDAAFYAKKQQAAGLIEMSKAYGELAGVLGGPSGLLHWMMLERGTYEKMAAENAKAVNGMQPKINIWNTGNQEGVDSTAPLRNLFQTLPPLLETIQQQTGMTPPAWLAGMPSTSNGENGKAVAPADGHSNGFTPVATKHKH
jgi:flotillin